MTNSGASRSGMPTYVVAILATCGGCLIVTVILGVIVFNMAITSTAYLDTRASALERQRRYSEAEAVLVTAVRKAPNDAHLLNNLAWVYYLDGKYASGEPYARHAVAIDANPYNVDTLAHIDLGLKRYDAAEKEFESALSARADSAESHDGLGQVYERQGQFKKALAEYRSAIAIDPNVEGTQARILRLEQTEHAAGQKGK